MKLIRSLMVTAGLLLLAVPSFAQTTLNSTTLAAAVTDVNAKQFQLTSTTNVSVGDYVAIVTGNVVREIDVVRAVSSPYITVTRDYVAVSADRKARKHANGSTVYTGAKTRFYSTDVNGTCTQAQEQYLPHISTTTGFVYQCSPAGVWYRLDQQFTVKCWSGALFTSSIDQSCWLADNNYVVTAINEVHTVKEAGGTLTLIPRKATGTQATASGAALATALDMAAAATVETVRAATLTTTSADLLLVAGNRLGLDFTDDVAGELAGVTVTFTVAPR